jgi:hypothetical protein
MHPESGGVVDSTLNTSVNAVPDPAVRENCFWYWGLAGLLLLLLLAVKVRHLQTAHIIRDEFEHMHAVWLVHDGQMPFADFFEHHTPLFYFVGATILPLRNASFQTMIRARYEGLAMEILVVVIALLWVRRRFGSAEALVVGTLFCTNIFLYLYGGFTYLDTYAAPLLLGSAILLDDQRNGWRIALSGLAFGLSVLLAIKAMMAAFAYLAYFLARAITELRTADGRRIWFKHVALFILGGLLSCALLAFLLGKAGMQGLWLDVVVMNSRWKSRYFPFEVTRLLATTDPLIYLVAIVAAFRQMWSLARRGFKVDDLDLPAFFLLSLCLGIFLIPVVWEEYYLLVLPFALILAGMTLTDFARKYLLREGKFLSGVDRRTWLIVLLLTAAMAIPAFTEVGHLSKLGAARLAVIVTAWVALFLLLAWKRSMSPRWKAILLIALVSVYPLQQQVYLLFRSLKNGEQRARVNYVMAHTKPSDAVFDGNSGYGVFRPHAFKYWLLHDEVQAMLTPEEKGPGLVESLQTRKPPIVIVDRFTQMLPPQVLDYINAHYDVTPFPDIKKRRTEK